MSENGHGPEEQERGLPPILPQPVPTAFSLDIAVGPQKRYVIVNVHTPSGVAIYFLEPEIAFEVAKSIRSAAQAAMREPNVIVPVESKLILPGD